MEEVRDAAVHFEAVKISMSQDKNGITCIGSDDSEVLAVT